MLSLVLLLFCQFSYLMQHQKCVVWLQVICHNKKDGRSKQSCKNNGSWQAQAMWHGQRYWVKCPLPCITAKDIEQNYLHGLGEVSATPLTAVRWIVHFISTFCFNEVISEWVDSHSWTKRREGIHFCPHECFIDRHCWFSILKEHS